MAIKRYAALAFMAVLHTFLMPESASAQCPVWTNMDQSYSGEFHLGYGMSAMAMDSSGTPYVAYPNTDNSIWVKKYNGTEWETIGSTGFPTEYMSGLSIAVDGSGMPYVAYTDFNNSLKITVIRHNGSDWEVIGTDFRTDGSSIAKIKTDASGTPYVAFIDANDGYKAKVIRYNGSDWEIVGGSAVSLSYTGEIAFALDASGMPYIVCEDGTNGRPSVKKYNGIAWETLDDGGLASLAVSQMALEVSKSGTPYFLFRNGHMGSQVNVKMYNGSSWETLGAAVSPNGVYYPALAVDDSGTVYAAYRDDVADQVVVKKYTGTGWEQLGTTMGFYLGTASTDLAIDNNGILYLKYDSYGYGMNFAAVEAYLPGPSHLIIATADENGGISPADTTVVCNYGSQTYTITPDPGYVINAIYVNGSYRGTMSSYTFDYVEGGPNTIYAYFRPCDPPMISVTGGTYMTQGDSAVLTASGGTTYTWAPAIGLSANTGESVTSSTMFTRTYTVSSTVDGCTGTATATVNVDPVYTCGGSWSNVGTAGLSVAQAQYTSMAVNASGTPYIVYSDEDHGYEATVKKYNGSSWETVGTEGFSTGRVYNTSIAIDASGTPYVAYMDEGNGNMLTVKKFDGTDWVTVGAEGISAPWVDYLSLAINSSGTPYVAYSDAAEGYKVTVIKYNGSAWETVGSPGASLGEAAYVSMAIAPDGRLYVAYQEVADNYSLQVMSFNGTYWDAGYIYGHLSPNAYYISIAVDNSGRPVVAFSDGSNGGKVTAMRYYYYTPWFSYWDYVGGTPMSEGEGVNTSIAIDGDNKAYVAYRDYTSGRAVVMAEHGPGWMDMSSESTSETGASYPSLATNGNGTVYLAFQDAAHSNKATVKRFSSTICPITGPDTVCVGATTTLSSSSISGTWFSNNTTKATVDAYGNVTGHMAGTVTISYTVLGQTETKEIAVRPTYTINATAGSNGSIIPAGSTSICSGEERLYVMTANSGYHLDSVYVDGISVDVATTYAFLSVNASHTIRATFASDCTAPINTSAASTTPVLCKGDNTGSVTPHVTGTTPLSWVWSNGYTTSSLTNVPAGVYTYTVSNGCGSVTGTATVTQPAAVLTAGKSVTNVNCYGGSTGSVSVTATGGTAPYSGTGNFTGKTAGTYNYTVTDNNGCISSVSATVSQPLAALSASGSITNVNCNGESSGSVLVSATGGTTPYTGDGNKPGLPAGAFSYTVMDANGCTSAYSGTISEPSQLVAAKSVTDVLCYGNSTGSVTISATGGTTPYSGTGTFSGKAAGTYTYDVTDAHGCISNISATVTQPAGGLVLSKTVSDVVCYGGNTGSVTISATGGTSPYVGTGTFSGKTAGTYSFTVSDESGCSSMITAVVAQPSQLLAGQAVTNVRCKNENNGSVIVSATGGTLPYSGTGTFSGLSPEAYSYTVTDDHGCTSTVSGTITEPTLLVASNTPVVSASGFNLLCNKGATGVVNVSATGGTAPYYNTGAHGGLTATGYEFYVTDSHGCIDSTSGTLTQPNPFYINTATSDDTVCNGTSVSLSATGSSSYYTWYANNGISTTNSATAVTATPSTGTPTVTVGYRAIGYNGFGCPSEPDTVDVTVLPIGYFTGANAVCTDLSVDLDNGTPGGVWYTPDTAYISLDQNGLVNALHESTSVTYPLSTTITYTMPNGCMRTKVLGVDMTPRPIIGIATVCPGTGLSLPAGIPSGGTWASSNANMTITMSSNGIATVFGASLGSADISYIMPSGCAVSKTFTVAPLAPITGATEVCAGNTITLSHPLPGAQWSSNNPAMATINVSTGVVNGLSANSVVMSYKVNPTCYRTYTVNVNTTPAAITGPVAVCKTANITLGDATAGGTWVSDNTSAATVNYTTGLVNGADAGVANISYVMPNGCYKMTTVTVNDNPASITGSTNVCVSRNATYTTTSTGGSWSSSSSVLTISAGPGVASGVAAGSANVIYTLPTGCYAVKPVNVSALPASITGTFTACQGSTTTVNCITASLTWSSSDENIATVGSTSTTSALVSGLLPGTTTISYASAAGCTQTVNVTIYAAPATIGGTTNVCVGSTATYTNSVTGGTWSSSATGVATVGSLTGIVTGIGAGTCNLIYTAPGGCKTTKMLTIDAQPTTFTGTLSTCVVGNTLLASTPTGGTWSTTSPNASVNASTGLVTGVAMGSAIISYTNTAGCSRAGTVTIAAGLPAIVGPSFICVGGTTTLTDATGGGTWVSSNTAAGTIASGTGLIGGIAVGNTTITYRTSPTCHTTKDIAVMSAPAPISAPAMSVCIGTPMQFTHAITTGTWSSSTPANATVGSVTGMVTGLAVGTATISYTTTPGCLVTQLMSVNAQPAVLTGTLNVCQGNTTTVNCMTSGCTWSTSDPDVAAIATSTATAGIITGGTTAGTVIISYTNALGCSRTAVATVNAAVPAITGYDVVCVGNTTPLSIAATGGTWSSSLPAKGSISTVGVVAGVATGSTTITYKTSNTCFTTKTMSVNGAVAAITGGPNVCKDNSVPLVCTTPGGTWATSSANASVIDTNGLVTGLATGSAVISYQLTGIGCYKTYTVNVLASPAPISGTMTIAIGTTTTLNNTVMGGTWSSSASTVAGIGSASGAMTGVTAGSATVTYKLTSNGCYKTALATVVTSMARPVKGTDMEDASVTTVRIFPNPSQGNITVEAPASGAFMVFSMDGKQIARFDVIAPATSVSLPYDLAAGMYMCRFDGVDGSSAIVRLVYKP